MKSLDLNLKKCHSLILVLSKPRKHLLHHYMCTKHYMCIIYPVLYVGSLEELNMGEACGCYCAPLPVFTTSISVCSCLCTYFTIMHGN